jgi:hypothetical protein
MAFLDVVMRSLLGDISDSEKRVVSIFKIEKYATRLCVTVNISILHKLL